MTAKYANLGPVEGDNHSSKGKHKENELNGKTEEVDSTNKASEIATLAELYQYADGNDCILMFIGTIAAIATGINGIDFKTHQSFKACFYTNMFCRFLPASLLRTVRNCS